MNETISLTAGTNLMLVVIITLLGLLFFQVSPCLELDFVKQKERKLVSIMIF